MPLFPSSSVPLPPSDDHPKAEHPSPALEASKTGEESKTEARPWRSLPGAIAFYTQLPVPQGWLWEFTHVARYAPLVGLMIGGLLAIAALAFTQLGMPPLTRAAAVVGLWVWITGGLHLDGAMDAADGLGVTDPTRRLDVMSDSRTGAFGVMVAIALVTLKIAALAESANALWLLPLVAGWGRWAQQVAIARYPYLKPSGKGAFHKAALPHWGYVLPSWALLLGLSMLPWLLGWSAPMTPLLLLGGGSAIALLVPAWFQRQLGGHTGDTYGATVEWTEALLLVLCTIG